METTMRRGLGALSVRALFAIFVSLLTGCSGMMNPISNRISYDDAVANQVLHASNNAPIAVLVQDNRPYVLNGNHSAMYVGTQRSIAGFPWPMRTKSGQALAIDLTESIERSLKAGGYNVVSIVPSPAIDQKILHFLITEWQSDQWFTSTFSYCVELKVKNLHGSEVASTSYCGAKKLGETLEFFDLRAATNTVIGNLINAPKIQSALKGKKL